MRILSSSFGAMSRKKKFSVLTCISFLTSAFLLVSCGDKKQQDYSESELKELGVVASTTPKYTKWRIPLAKVHEKDKQIAFDAMIQEYRNELFKLKAEMGETFGLKIQDEDSIRTDAFADLVEERVQAIIAGRAETKEEIAHTMTTDYNDFQKMTNWRSYTIPQAFILFAGAKVGGGAGLRVAKAATIFIVIQPWLEVVVDNDTAEIISKEWLLLTELFGIPNLSFGYGGGAETGPMFGVGAAFGPIKHPSDMEGIGVGASWGIPIPLFGGVFGQVSFLLNTPLIYYVTGGVSFNHFSWGTPEAEIPILLDLNRFKAAFKSVMTDVTPELKSKAAEPSDATEEASEESQEEDASSSMGTGLGF